ncbi:hypothetical protein DFQ28_009227 [Apophysomyces sp. BC1034]|nr:hypothetical protein DFQ30_008960 [Apophysomyces sp. BC1015]KAG0178372.1 hypothetical protein DFQ29_003576 [Apophysomyces sp. BC1021]KAG0185500.1 hypothetical protein DFQ28_009227 [Apophysomyces sp. BC1034]
MFDSVYLIYDIECTNEDIDVVLKDLSRNVHTFSYENAYANVLSSAIRNNLYEYFYLAQYGWSLDIVVAIRKDDLSYLERIIEYRGMPKEHCGEWLRTCFDPNDFTNSIPYCQKYIDNSAIVHIAIVISLEHVKETAKLITNEDYYAFENIAPYTKDKEVLAYFFEKNG